VDKIGRLTLVKNNQLNEIDKYRQNKMDVNLTIILCFFREKVY
jgi:hypothetical protein